MAEAAGGRPGRLRARRHRSTLTTRSTARVRRQVLRAASPGAAAPTRQASESIPINFAAPPGRSSPRPNQSRLILAALAAVPCSGGWAWIHDAERRGREPANLQNHKADLEKDVKALEPDAKRLDAAAKWRARQVNWLDELFDATDRFRQASEKLRTNQRMTAALFKGTAIPPDTKTGKQQNQAKIDLKVASTAIEPVNAIVDSMRQRESKYYVGADKTTGGPSQGDVTSRDYSIAARVNGRPPGEYTRFPSFVPPVRKYYPPTKAMMRESAPSPKEKPDEEGEG